MAYVGLKGYYVSELKKLGVTKHPDSGQKLEKYKTSVLFNLHKSVTNK